MDTVSWEIVREILGDVQISLGGKRALESAFEALGERVFTLAALARDHAKRNTVRFFFQLCFKCQRFQKGIKLQSKHLGIGKRDTPFWPF